MTPCGLANTAGCGPQEGVCSRAGCSDARAGAEEKTGAHGAARHPHRYGNAAAKCAPVRLQPVALHDPSLALQAAPQEAPAPTPHGLITTALLALPVSRGLHSSPPRLPHCSSPPAGSSRNPAAGSSSSRRPARYSPHCQHYQAACSHMAPGSQGLLMGVLRPCPCLAATPPWQLEQGQVSQVLSRAALVAQGA
jgi:hypothetical protein